MVGARASEAVALLCSGLLLLACGRALHVNRIEAPTPTPTPTPTPSVPATGCTVGFPDGRVVWLPSPCPQPTRKNPPPAPTGWPPS
jgi:hypothetical protein